MAYIHQMREKGGSKTSWEKRMCTAVQYDVTMTISFVIAHARVKREIIT